MVLMPVFGEAATTSWLGWARMATVFEPIRPVPPMTTIFKVYPPDKRSVFPGARYPPKDVAVDCHMADGRERQVSGHQRLAVRRELPQKTDPDAGCLLGVVFEAVVPGRGARTRPETRRRRRTSADRRRTPGGPRCARGCGRRCVGRAPPAPPRTRSRTAAAGCGTLSRNSWPSAEARPGTLAAWRRGR